MRHFLLTMIICFLAPYLYSQEVYTPFQYREEHLFYISTSDNIMYDYENEKEEDILIPDDYRFNVPKDKREYVYLSEPYRARLLNKLSLNEDDSMYIYNYTTNKLTSYPLRKVRAIAVLSGYESFNDENREEWGSGDYHIGFEIPKEDPTMNEDNYYNNYFIVIAEENPFEVGKMYPMLWKQVDNREFPIHLLSSELKKLTTINDFTSTYLYNLFDYTYYVQKQGEDLQTIVVLKNKKLISSELIYRGESTSLSPLTTTSYDVNYPYFHLTQWTGKLFKDKAPVYFGFTYRSFGCPHITPMTNDGEDYIIINCDNRH